MSFPKPPSVGFDDIPGELPTTNVPTDFNTADASGLALVRLNDLRPDSFTDKALWRDLLSLTGTYRTFDGPAVFTNLEKLSNDKQRTQFKLLGNEPRHAGGPLGCSWIDVDVTFRTTWGNLTCNCAGIASLLWCEDGAWRIWMLRTWLECFNGHGSPDVLEPRQQQSETLANGQAHTIQEKRGINQTYVVVIVGGGQAGLSTAGRLHALDVKYILLEKHAEIGDVWVKRYESLRWHTSKEYGNLPFGRTFPAEDDYMLPAKRIGAGHRAWAEKYGLNFRTKTTVDSASWDDIKQLWTVNTTGPHGEEIFMAQNLVLAIGAGHATPIYPKWAAPENVTASGFKGYITHAPAQYQSSLPWAGKRGVVIGTANTGHDVAEDMANCGMHTTMIQRSPTFIFPAPWLHHAQDLNYHVAKPVEMADRETFTYPNKIMREMINRIVHHLIHQNPEPFDALENAGFKVERFGDTYHNLYSRFGGHYVDIGCSARIAKGEIKVKAASIKHLNQDGLVLEDGSTLPADLIVLCTGFNHDFRNDAARIVGREVANQMDDYWGVDAEGELRGYAKIAGHPHLYYHGGDVRLARWFSRFIALQIQADTLGQPLRPYHE